MRVHRKNTDSIVEPVTFDPYAPPLATAYSVVGGTPNGGLTGIGGWLLFLCIWLVFFLPFQVVVQAYFALVYHTRFTTLSAADLNLTIAQFGLMAAMALYGAIVGLWIWLRHPSALIRARKFVALRLAISLGSTFMTWVCTQMTTISIWANIPAAIVQALTHFAIIWLYLKRSRRVANTFPAAIRRFAKGV